MSCLDLLKPTVCVHHSFCSGSFYPPWEMKASEKIERVGSVHVFLLTWSFKISGNIAKNVEQPNQSRSAGNMLCGNIWPDRELFIIIWKESFVLIEIILWKSGKWFSAAPSFFQLICNNFHNSLWALQWPQGISIMFVVELIICQQWHVGLQLMEL